jgi:AGZA family xanthine/uracil permease-like MFS transporter
VIEKLFKLTEHNTSVSKECLAGLTTFLTMSYIIFVNPAILSQTGMDQQSVFVATCLASAIGTILIGVLANYPFAQAPGMGLNAFFTFTVVFGLGFSWQQGLAIVFVSGLLFLLLTITGLRAAIIESIPRYLKLAIAPGIGLFIALIGLNNAGLIQVNQGPIIDILLSNEGAETGVLIEKVKDAPSQIIQLGKLNNPSVLLSAIGFVILTIFMVMKIKAAMIWAVLVTTIIGIPMGVVELPVSYDLGQLSVSKTAFQLDLASLFIAPEGKSTIGALTTVFVVIISFTLVDLLDTMGTLLGTASKGNMLDTEGNLPRMNRALYADATATTFGALLGTSSVTTYIESSAGIVEGGRTGLTACVTGLLFIASMFLAPIAGMVPPAATSPILIMVGLLMLDGIKKIDVSNVDVSIPVFMTIIMMPFTYSIANGIAFGLIFYVLIQLVKGQIKSVHPILYILLTLFMLKYIAL